MFQVYRVACGSEDVTQCTHTNKRPPSRFLAIESVQEMHVTALLRISSAARSAGDTYPGRDFYLR